MRILLSACRAGLPVDENTKRSCELVHDIVKAGYSVEVAAGVYQEDGQHEASHEVTLVVTVPSEGYSPELVDTVTQEWAVLAADRYQQDCVGVLYDGLFYLAYVGKELERVGKFTAFSTRPMGNATLINGMWYQAVKE